MRRINTLLFTIVAVIFSLAPSARAFNVPLVMRVGGKIHVVGNGAAKRANISWQGRVATRANPGGSFNFNTSDIPATCMGYVSDGVQTVQVAVDNCTPQNFLPATGQTTPYKAIKNDGGGAAVDVPDDGTLQTGAPLSYLDTGLTIIDLNTGLEWEKKCSCRGLHDVANVYSWSWSASGPQETIWDWLDDVNAEGSAGYAGHSDWRIPNVKELHSIVDYGRSSPSIDPIFGATFPGQYWSSTTRTEWEIGAWFVGFGFGLVDDENKELGKQVRAVRGP